MADSQVLAEETADSALAPVDRLAEGLDDPDAYLSTGDEYEDVLYRELDEWPLEIVRQVGRPFTVVVGTGGPHVEIVCEVDGGGGRQGDAKIEVYWSSGNARRYGSSVNDVADYYVGMFEGME